jgi:hypothetical protein
VLASQDEGERTTHIWARTAVGEDTIGAAFVAELRRLGLARFLAEPAAYQQSCCEQIINSHDIRI